MSDRGKCTRETAGSGNDAVDPSLDVDGLGDGGHDLLLVEDVVRRENAARFITRNTMDRRSSRNQVGQNHSLSPEVVLPLSESLLPGLE